MLKWLNTQNMIWLSLWISLIHLSNLAAQISQEPPKTKIEISSQVNQTRVPLNRPLELKITLSWIGNSDSYSVIQFDNPSLTNFEIAGSSTTKRTEFLNNQMHIFNDYIYTLKPKELGMGYIEGVTVKIRNNTLNKDENMRSQRIPVEVVDSVPEPGESRPLLFIFLMIALILSLGISLGFWLRWKKKMKEQTTTEPEFPMESRYLGELRSQFNLDQPNLHEDFFKLSKLLRRYLTEKFAIRALEVTTDDLVLLLKEISMEENQKHSIKDILSRSDEIKFSGTKGTQEELTRFYTLIEGIMETFLRKAEDATKEKR